MRTGATAVAVALALCGGMAASGADTLVGPWSGGDWGKVQIVASGKSYTGSYTDTFGGKKGAFEFSETAPGQFAGKWREPEKGLRSGTFKLSLSKDQKSLRVVWQADQNRKITLPGKGVSLWTRQAKPAWQALSVQTEPYGAGKDAKVLAAIRTAARKFVGKAMPRAGSLADQLPKAFSNSKAVDVFVTYALVDGSGTVLETRVVELGDADAALWWGKDAADFKTHRAERERLLKKGPPAE